MSTSHYKHEVSLDEKKKKKPLMIDEYNKTKGGTDTMDKMLSEYTCHRRTNRWPMAFFYNMFDVSGLASYIILKENLKVKDLKRVSILKDLAVKLCMPQIIERLSKSHVMKVKSTKMAIDYILCEQGNAPIDPIEQDIRRFPMSRKRNNNNQNCTICHKEDKKKKCTRNNCDDCDKPVCGVHSVKITVCDGCNFVRAL